MIKKLKRKFILVNMALVGIVLCVAFTAICVYHYRMDERQMLVFLERSIDMRGFTDQEFAPPDAENPPNASELVPTQSIEYKRPEIGLPADERNQYSDAMYLTYTVLTDAEGNLLEVLNQDVDISETSLATAVSAAIQSDQSSGTISSLRLAYCIKQAHDGYLISFTDYSPVLSSLRNLIITFLMAGIGILVAFFFISFFLARWIIRPVENAWEQQRQFIADASHELKTPLTVILANTGIVLGHRDETIRTQEKWISYIREEAERMKKLVEDMLFLAKSDAAKLPAVMSEVNLSDLAWSCLLPFESIAFEQHLILDSNIAPDLTVQGNTGQLKELITILLDNACKYCAADGSINVTLTGGDRIRLTVHNTGSYIPEEKCKRLFERFYRVDESRDRNAGGYGLGLAIAKSICDLHHAKISVKSSHEGGTSFTVMF